MSSHLPPPEGSGPHHDATGQPFARSADAATSETLSGGPDGAASADNRRGLVVLGATAGVLALGIGATWAAVSFFATGEQPASALPATTIGYVSIDLDPSGAQKIEAIKMLNKFPAIRDELSLDADDDLRKKLFEAAQEEGGLCSELDYAEDLEPWLGDRAAFAVVNTGSEEPTAVMVVQVTDPEAAEASLTEFADCDGSSTGGWTIAGDWAYAAEDDASAELVAAAAAKGTLADDEDYQRWTDELGSAGWVNMYLAPGLGEMFSGVALDEDSSFTLNDESLPPEALTALENFPGAAATVRFDDGSLELAAVAGATEDQQAIIAGGGGGVVASLPADTAAAMGMAFGDGWLEQMLTPLAELSDITIEEMYAEAETQTGLELPEDAETLVGDAMAISVGSDLDLEAITNSSDLSGVPIALKVKGDAAAIEAVLAKLTAQLPPDAAELFTVEGDGDYAVISPNADYRATVLAEGGLGDTEAFGDVVEGGEDASMVMFVDFDAGDDWLVRMAESDPQAAENLAPLSGLGMSAWVDGDVGHVQLSLTTD